MKQIPPIRLDEEEYKKYYELKEKFEKANPPASFSMSGWGRYVIKEGLKIIENELKKKTLKKK